MYGLHYRLLLLQNTTQSVTYFKVGSTHTIYTVFIDKENASIDVILSYISLE